MESNPYESPASSNEAAIRSGSPGKRLFFTMLAVLGGLVLLAALLMPAMRRVPRGAAMRMNCMNNLRQIAVGLRLYEDQYGALPPAYTVDSNGKRLHSWRTLILPFIDHQTLYDSIDLTKPWDDPVNKEACDSMFDPYVCPELDHEEIDTTYLAVLAPGGCFLPTESRELSDITDDHAKTLMVIEVDKEHSVPWMSPVDADEEMILSLTSSESLAHPGGMNAVFVDGRGSFLDKETKAERLRAMISIAGDDDESVLPD